MFSAGQLHHGIGKTPPKPSSPTNKSPSPRPCVTALRPVIAECGLPAHASGRTTSLGVALTTVDPDAKQRTLRVRRGHLHKTRGAERFAGSQAPPAAQPRHADVARRLDRGTVVLVTNVWVHARCTRTSSDGLAVGHYPSCFVRRVPGLRHARPDHRARVRPERHHVQQRHQVCGHVHGTDNWASCK